MKITGNENEKSYLRVHNNSILHIFMYIFVNVAMPMDMGMLCAVYCVFVLLICAAIQIHRIKYEKPDPKLDVVDKTKKAKKEKCGIFVGFLC